MVKPYILLFRLNVSQIIAVSFETAIQNNALCISLLLLTFDSPHGDIAAIVPLAQHMFTRTCDTRIKFLSIVYFILYDNKIQNLYQTI